MTELNIDQLRALCEQDRIKWSLHALKRLRERNIKIEAFKSCIMCGEIIKQYPDDRPTPSCLILGWILPDNPLHVVVGSDGSDIYAITAYRPNSDEWESDMKTRKGR